VSEKTVSGYVPKTFKDAGTGETFEGGKTHQFTPGAHANYLAAKKIGEATKAGKADNAPDADAKGKPGA
jgi:hypothetical protein